MKVRFYKKIGEGGCASVHECALDDDPTRYALKRLETPDEEQVHRFQTELRILSVLDHPNIVKVLLRLRIDSILCYVMPLYKTSLENELIHVSGDNTRITSIFSSILDAVEHAHSQGVLHRDLKPLNILMNSETEVVVSDFGLGRFVESASTRNTATGQSVGSYLYTAPEQWDNLKQVDARADIFSLGKLLHAMCLGHAPLNADMEKISAGFSFIINKCTAYKPEHRFQKVSDLKSAWHNLLDGSANDSELSELERLSAELSVPSNEQNQSMQSRFLELLLKHQDNEDVFHQRVMEVDASCFAALYEKEPDTVRRILRSFAEYVCVRSWPFIYTDRIADQCKQIYFYVVDFELRAEILSCLLQLGVEHNRWHVMGRFSELILYPKDIAEIVILHDKLSAVDIRTREKISEFLNVSRLPNMLQALFQFDNSSQQEMDDSA